MQIDQLGEDRFLRKDPNQTDQTKGAVYASLNPSPKRGDDSRRKIGRPTGNEDDGGAPNVLTGTVITSCFIQTSALPSRIELQGNDITFFDDTTASNGVVSGDTARLVFTHGSAKQGSIITSGFIMEKRASEFSTYDNVLSWYAVPPPAGNHNFMFIGRDARVGSPEFNMNTIVLAINQDTTYTPEATNLINGIFQVEYAEDTQFKGIPLLMGASRFLFGAPFNTGYSSLIIAGLGGISGLAYFGTGGLVSPLYVMNGTSVTLGADMIPDTDGAYDIGSASFQIKDLYLSGTIHGGSLATGFYAGIIDSGGTTGTLPPGWSVARLGSGDYVVTHNLGVPNSVVGSSAAPAMALFSGNNSFEVQSTLLNGAALDATVNFILKVL